jgi:hypothetical protein
MRYDRDSGGDDDDFFASLESELKSGLRADGDNDSYDGVVSTSEIGAFPEKEEKTTRERRSSSEPPTTDVSPATSPTGSASTEATSTSSGAGSGGSGTGSSSVTNWNKLTVPALKELLKERGLKVTGKKAELIERLGGR